jgi:hypothetical protein
MGAKSFEVAEEARPARPRSLLEFICFMFLSSKTHFFGAF